MTTTTNKERWIYQQVVDMSRTLGIAVPDVGLAYSKKQARELTGTKRYDNWMGYYRFDQGEYCKVTIMVRHKQHKKLRELRETIAHELIHIAFPKMQHGDSFEGYYIKSLLQGHMMFDGRGIIGKMKRPDPTLDKQINELVARRKKYETRIKRANTAIKKIDRKIKHLRKKQQQEKQQSEPTPPTPVVVLPALSVTTTTSS
jgi:hypothetical protein